MDGYQTRLIPRSPSVMVIMIMVMIMVMIIIMFMIMEFAKRDFLEMLLNSNQGLVNCPHSVDLFCSF